MRSLCLWTLKIFYATEKLTFFHSFFPMEWNKGIKFHIWFYHLHALQNIYCVCVRMKWFYYFQCLLSTKITVWKDTTQRTFIGVYDVCVVSITCNGYCCWCFFILLHYKIKFLLHKPLLHIDQKFIKYYIVAFWNVWHWQKHSDISSRL